MGINCIWILKKRNGYNMSKFKQIYFQGWVEKVILYLGIIFEDRKLKLIRSCITEQYKGYILKYQII